MSHQYLEAKKTEADFYVQQGLNEEAVKIYEELLEANPDDKGIIEAIFALKNTADSSGSSTEKQAAPGSAHGHINNALNAILQEEVKGDLTSDDCDYEALFQKGIGYRRQGQLDEAIKELQKASNDPENIVRNSRMLAMCYAEQDNYRDAIREFEKACHELSSDDSGYLDIQYELADVYMKNGDNDKAQFRYAAINQYDPTFRDVAHKMESLQPPGTGETDDAPEMSSGRTAVQTRPKKNRISYL